MERLEKKPVMEVFLDKDFITNFWNISLVDKTIIDDFKDTFLKKAKNFCLKTNFTSFDEIKDNEEYSVIMEMLFESIPEMEFSVQTHKTDWLNNELNASGGYKLFLIEIEQKECEEFTLKTGFEFICSRNLSNCWKKYITKEIRKSMITKGRDNDSDVLNNWKDLSFISKSPTNSIIIVDRYINRNNEGQKIEENLYPLLETIIPIGICFSLDILIIAEDISQELHQQINRHFARFQKKIKIRFSFLKWDKKFMGIQKIHDRHIYTNYFTICSGPGFNLFHNNLLKENDDEFNVRFSFEEFNMKEYPHRLEHLKNYLVKCKQKAVWYKLKYYPENTKCTMLD